MATMQDVVRKILISAKTEGVDQADASLRKLATTQGVVAVATEKSDKAMLSLEGQLDRLKRSVDEEYRSEEKLAQVEKTLSAARAQGLISMTEQNRLLDLASAKYKATGESAKMMGEGLATAKEFAIGLIGGLGAGVLLTGLAEIPAKIKEAVEAGAQLKDTAETIGIAADNLQKLQYAASQTGISDDTINSALEKFSVNLGKAKQGSGELYDILKANHRVISGDITRDLESYADLIQHSTNAEQRNLLTTAAFGKGATEVGRLFNDGAEGIKRLTDEAANAGVVLGGDTLEQAHRLDDEFASLQKQLDVAFEGFMINIAPALVETLGGITNAVKLANAALEVGKGFLYNGDQASKLIQQRDTSYIEDDLKTQQTLLKAAQATLAGDVTLQGLMAVGAGGGSIPGYQKKIAEDQAELAARSAGATEGYVGSYLLNSGWGRLPKATITPNPTDTAAAARQAADYQRVTDAITLQKNALTETDRQKEIDAQLSAAHVAASSKEGQALSDLAGKYYDERKAIADANQAASFFAQTTESAFQGILDGSSSVEDALLNVAKAIAEAALQAELLGSGPLAGILGTSPTTSGGAGGILGSLFSALIPHADGGVHTSPSLSAYSNTIVDKPTFFKFASGGVMGEAGPEAIMPLRRGPDGKLGVAASNSNGSPVQVQIAIRMENDGTLQAVVEHVSNAKAVEVVTNYDAALPGRLRQITKDPRAA